MANRDTEADRSAIAALCERKMAALNNADVDAFLATLADGMMYHPPNQPSVVGKDQIGPWVTQGFFENFQVKYRLTNEQLEVSGDLAVSRGPFTLQLTPKGGGDPIQDNGKFVNVYKRGADGEWKFTHIIFNSDRPAPG